MGRPAGARSSARERLAALALELGEPLAHAGATRCRPRAARRSRDRPARAARRRAASASRGSPTSTASDRVAAARAPPSGRVQSSWSRKSEIIADEARAAWRAARAARSASASAAGSRWPSRPTPASSSSRTATIPGLRAARRRARSARRRRTRRRRRSRPGGPRAARARARRPRRRRPSAAWAVPNAIDGETSSTIQVVSARSGTCRRTCGWPVRAVAAGVEVADVVAGLVGPQLRELGPGARRRPRAGRRAARARPAARPAGRARRPARCGDRPRALAPGRAARAGAGWGIAAQRRRRPRIAPRAGRDRAARGPRRGPLEHVVGGHALAERVVGEHDAGGAGRRARGRGRRRRSRGRGRAAAPARARPGPARSARAGWRRTRSWPARSASPYAAGLRVASASATA